MVSLGKNIKEVYSVYSAFIFKTFQEKTFNYNSECISHKEKT